MLSRDRLREVYDRVGSRQDSQSFYEAPALDLLVRYGAFGSAETVLEIGCGTGAFAERLLAGECPETTTYEAIELSCTMASIARARLEPWADRVTVRWTDGAPPIDNPSRSVDRVVVAYVFDLLPRPEVRTLLSEARRVLKPGGRLCACGLAPGIGPMSRAVEWLWRSVFALRPTLVGGCRPLEVRPLLGRSWRVHHHDHVAPWGVPSEVLVATPRPDTV
ncbi:hypothetical protein CRI94_05245 [Longibacter salinarum]|uniref:Methyltransferase domain-containing protein n=1 Tax=Longibacter salinarum TaxID=1850348 RepID=A0A2A8D0V4_9BACT|nr:class I SAM-dependent methyltransferase [Longibacter salinarum]PEN14433.1 hypothetical protein CRI94_05245 [Longibacter salinarum]